MLLFVEQNRHKNFRHVILWYAEKRFMVRDTKKFGKHCSRATKEGSIIFALSMFAESCWSKQSFRLNVWGFKSQHFLTSLAQISASMFFFPDLTNMLQFYSVLKYVKKSETTFRNYNKLVQLCCVVYASISRG